MIQSFIRGIFSKRNRVQLLKLLGLIRKNKFSSDISVGVNYLTSNSDEPSDKAKQVWEVYKYIRLEIQHEYNLLLGRVTWFITCQSFLLAIYGVSYTNSKGANWFSNILIAGLGVVLSYLAGEMVEGTISTIGMWTERRKSLVRNYHLFLDSILIPRWRLKSLIKRDYIHNKALLFPVFITKIFLPAWLAIAILSWYYPWLSKDTGNVAESLKVVNIQPLKVDSNSDTGKKWFENFIKKYPYFHIMGK